MNINLIKLLSKLKNASFSRQESMFVGYSQLSLEIVKLLYREGFIQSFFVLKDESKLNDKLVINITLRYLNNKPIFKTLKIISTPSSSKYLNIKDLSKISSKKMVLFLSTNKGLLTGLESKMHKTGGKLLFTV
jgi:small subunit ribosomal protein S8